MFSKYLQIARKEFPCADTNTVLPAMTHGAMWSNQKGNTRSTVNFNDSAPGSGLWHIAVRGIVAWMTLVRLLNLGRWDVVAAAPNLDLVISVLGSCVCLVQALQAAIVTLVESPRVHNWHSEVLGLHADRPRGLDCPAQDGGEDDVKLEALLLDDLASVDGLLLAILAQVDIMPAGEDVGNVPQALAMADKDDLVNCAAHGATGRLPSKAMTS